MSAPEFCIQWASWRPQRQAGAVNSIFGWAVGIQAPPFRGVLVFQLLGGVGSSRKTRVFPRLFVWS